ncbi:MAG: RNA 2',3'-cyclic phosphodiesterase [Candidatus Cybelea sp.]
MVDAPPRKRKLFVGIDLREDARARCAAVSQTLRKMGFDARYETPEKLHVTLAFLGYVEPALCEEVVSELSAAGSPAKPFALMLDKLGAFPHERRPRVVYVGAREQGAPFRELAQSVRGAYARLGFDFKDDAVAHVTIARVKESKRPLPLVEFPPILVEVERLTLFESLPDPSRKTSRYEVKVVVPLCR